MAVKTYSPQDILITIAGTEIHGFADGTFCSVERSRPNFEKVTGADGQTARAYVTDRSGTLTLTLMQTSDSNDFLSGLAQQDEKTKDAVFTVQVKDNRGTSLFFSATGWIEQLPSAEFSNEISEREWIIALADMEYFSGGNTSIT